jgi:hypothetical protein
MSAFSSLISLVCSFISSFNAASTFFTINSIVYVSSSLNVSPLCFITCFTLSWSVQFISLVYHVSTEDLSSVLRAPY